MSPQSRSVLEMEAGMLINTLELVLHESAVGVDEAAQTYLVKMAGAVWKAAATAVLGLLASSVVCQRAHQPATGVGIVIAPAAFVATAGRA